MTPSRQHAIVIGASVAGLCAARALSEIFDHVTVIDRDELPSEPVARRGVPQSRQLHFLLVRGREALDELFPGVSEDLIRAGAVAADMQADFNWNFVGHPMRKAPSDLVGIGVTRSLLEFTLRSRVMRLPTVTVIERCDVTGLRADPDRRGVTGVRARSRADTQAEITLGADLVVDACGRGTRSATWLESLGYSEHPRSGSASSSPTSHAPTAVNPNISRATSARCTRPIPNRPAVPAPRLWALTASRFCSAPAVVRNCRPGTRRWPSSPRASEATTSPRSSVRRRR